MTSQDATAHRLSCVCVDCGLLATGRPRRDNGPLRSFPIVLTLIDNDTMTAVPRETAPTAYVRNPELLSAANSRLLIVDVQEKLLPLIPTPSPLVTTCHGLS